MGLTYQSTKSHALTDIFHIDKNDNQFVIALAGNPNTGKSTVFNSLTGLHQHTGNWPGKTVVNARGEFSYKDQDFILVDLPGTYSCSHHRLKKRLRILYALAMQMLSLWLQMRHAWKGTQILFIRLWSLRIT